MAGIQDQTTQALAPGVTWPRSTEQVIASREPCAVEPKAGDRIGRYTLLAPLGRGGMGVVFATHDDRLDRKLALKLLRPPAEGQAAAWQERSGRLLREAQALAQLSHPNVVEVFDVGTEADALYIAMELVEGLTLRAWLAAADRPWREVVQMFEQAGRGLAAAHAVELIHRDFKPANVLVDRRGRARVLDFGLALPTEARASVANGPRASTDGSGRVLHERGTSSRGEPTGTGSMTGSSVVTDRLVSPLTAAGTVMGTPAYMAPEQHASRELGPAADQYAFCVALFEGLYGTRPFTGKDVDELSRAKQHGAPAEPPRAEVPRSLHRALVRGLAPDPAERWPSMDALLAELDRAVRGRRRWRWWAAGGTVVVAGGLALASLGRQDPAAGCPDAAASLARAWDPSRRAELRQALVATEVPYASDTADRVQSQLDGYASRWALAHAEVCEDRPATADRGADRGRQLVCLERRLRRMQTVVDRLTDAGSELLPQAVAMVDGLGSIERCLDEHPDGGRALPSQDSALAPRVAEVYVELEEVQVEIAAGRYDEALAKAQRLHADAQALGYVPLLAATGSRVGEAMIYAGRPKLAAQELEDAVHAAESEGLDLLALSTVTRLAVLAGQQGLLDEGLRWARHGEAILARTTDDGYAEADLRTGVGSMLTAAGRMEDAAIELSHAVRLWVSLLGPEDLQVAAARNNLGIAYYELGRYQDAVDEYEHALRIRRSALGPEHPDVALVLNNLANARGELGQLMRAQALREEVLELWSRNLGEDHPYVAGALNNLGGSASALGEHEQAVAYFERALALRERTLAPEHPEVATTRLNLGGELGELGRSDEALVELRRARQSLQDALGDHPWTAIAIAAMAEVLLRAQREQEAVAACEESVAMWERLGEPEHPQAAQTRHVIGDALATLGRLDDARAQLERALAIQERGGVSPDLLARTRFSLARVLRRQEAGYRADELARQALRHWQQQPSRADDPGAEIQAWLDAPGPGSARGAGW
ncbi:MAG: serine/threonine-protein kinase [Nannocystaceae bacterium]